jgi:signal peptidase I
METEMQAADRPSWWQVLAVGRNPKRTLLRALIWVVAAAVISHFVLVPIRIEGVSMLPTYHDHHVNFVNRLAYLFHPPQRGDVVAIRTSGLSIMYMKRIIGLPGETICFHHGHAVIDGQVLEEPYVKYPCDWELPPEQLGPDEYYFVGDNRNMFAGDHTKGRAHRNRIVGKVLL